DGDAGVWRRSARRRQDAAFRGGRRQSRALMALLRQAGRGGSMKPETVVDIRSPPFGSAGHRRSPPVGPRGAPPGTGGDGIPPPPAAADGETARAAPTAEGRPLPPPGAAFASRVRRLPTSAPLPGSCQQVAENSSNQAALDRLGPVLGGGQIWDKR